jgi:hypothetical protein
VRAPVRLMPLVVAMTVVGVVLLSGCTGDRSTEASSSQDTQDPAPRLGGRVPEPRSPPHRPMNRLERPLAALLSRRIAHEGLTLEFLDCPRWDGVVPSSIACRGYIDGLVAAVRVHLTAASAGGAVSFDARLAEGMIATRSLEETLVDHGLDRPECGDVPAYPALVGSRITCRVFRSGRVRYIVATVTDRSGEVRIADYRDAGG